MVMSLETPDNVSIKRLYKQSHIGLEKHQLNELRLV
jgi:hypothetical protein